MVDPGQLKEHNTVAFTPSPSLLCARKTAQMPIQDCKLRRLREVVLMDVIVYEFRVHTIHTS